MDKALLAKLGRRLYGKSTPDDETVRWDDLTPEKQREWIRMAARVIMLVVEPRFESLIPAAKAEAAKQPVAKAAD